MTGNTQGGTRQLGHVQPRSPLRRMGLRQLEITRNHQSSAEESHETEHRAPAERDLNPSADDRGHSRREGEDHGHETEEPLRLRTFIKVTNDSAAGDHAGARTGSL